MKNICCILLTLLLCCCGNSNNGATARQEDEEAKKLLQGVWIDEEDGMPSFKVEGDSIFYPDTTSMPVRFCIVEDTLVLYGVNTAKYPILKQTEHLFQFGNHDNETVRLAKADDAAAYRMFFENTKGIVLNQGRTIKRDTVITANDVRYHCYTQVNPTRYKVFRTSYNDEGVEVDNVYYDNSVHIAIFNGASKIYSHDFYKSDFSGQISKEILAQCVLSDMTLEGADASGFRYKAQICVPDSPNSYIVGVAISPDGKVGISVSEN